MEESPQRQRQTNFKHYCRVCKKGFMCGRALGGHMRAHGIGDDAKILGGGVDDSWGDEEEEEEEEKLPGNNSRSMYQLRTNPNRLKSCRNCENCGKEFSSWKSFLDHGKCISDEGSESLVSTDDDDDDRRRKGKRSLNDSNCDTDGEEDDEILLARCLVRLANTVMEASPAESCASASREEERWRNPSSFNDSPKAKGIFECKACKKVFNSHQALGGHRASHKKVKGCFASKTDENAGEDEVITNNGEYTPARAYVSTAPRNGKTKKHECSICHRVFPSGRALGGHKRCHWITNNMPENSRLQFSGGMTNNNNNNGKALDLNVPMWAHLGGGGGDRNDPLRLELCTAMKLRIEGPRNAAAVNGSDNYGGVVRAAEDEADSRLKLESFKEMNSHGGGGEASQWLQVGIGSTPQPALADL